MTENNQKGLTLIELMTIIGILAILALLSMPFLRSFVPSIQLSGATRDLIADLRYAEQLSVTEQIEHGIRFSSSTNAYQLIKYGEPETEIQSKILPEKISFYSISGFTNDEVKFNPYGAARETGLIILENSNNATTAIDVRPSGFIKIEK